MAKGRKNDREYPFGKVRGHDPKTCINQLTRLHSKMLNFIKNLSFVYRVL